MHASNSALICLSYLLLFPSLISFSIPSQKSYSQTKLKSSLFSIPTKDSPTNKSIKNISDELLSLVLNRWNKGTKENDAQIESLMNTLIESNTKFDPNDSLLNTFYATLYTSGSKKEPLWKTIAELFSDKNIQGQKYLSGDKDGEGYVVNYSEILGKGIHLCAYGTFDKNDKALDDTSIASNNDKNINPLMKLFQPNKITMPSSQIDCPVDYTAKVNEAAILVFDKKLSIPIAGTGTVRVLYADPQLRIFISPNDNTDSRWEKAGLKVVQVRIDLVDDELEYWNDLTNPNMQ